MQNTVNHFELRKLEINLFFNFLKQIVDHQGKLSLSPGFNSPSNRRKTVAIHSDVVNTMKASGILLIYNLVESTIKKSLFEIKDHINSNNHSFDDLSHGIQKKFISLLSDSDMRGHINNAPRNSQTRLAKSIINAAIDKYKLGGNLHYESIKKIGDLFGFDPGKQPQLLQFNIAEPLLEIKDRRNDLAHGDIAFLACGQNFSVDQLIAIKGEIELYLESLIENISTYLDSKGYLAVPEIS